MYRYEIEMENCLALSSIAKRRHICNIHMIEVISHLKRKNEAIHLSKSFMHINEIENKKTHTTMNTRNNRKIVFSPDDHHQKHMYDCVSFFKTLFKSLNERMFIGNASQLSPLIQIDFNVQNYNAILNWMAKAITIQKD